MPRELQSIHRTTTHSFAALPDDSAAEDALATWLLAAFPQGEWLLAHTTNGVVWGRVQGSHPNATLQTSSGRFHPYTLGRLRPSEIQQCRFFCEQGELLLWHDGDGLWPRLYLDSTTGTSPDDQGMTNADICYFDEAQILWGTQVEKQEMPAEAQANNVAFTLVSDGAQGLCHAVPFAAAELQFDPINASLKQRTLRLVVRHYVAHDHDGTLTIAANRLVKLDIERI